MEYVDEEELLTPQTFREITTMGETGGTRVLTTFLDDYILKPQDPDPISGDMGGAAPIHPGVALLAIRFCSPD